MPDLTLSDRRQVLRIGVEASALRLPRSGIGRYALSVTERLLKMATNGAQFCLYSYDDCLPRHVVEQENVIARIARVPLPFFRGLTYLNLWLPHMLRRDGVDVFYAPATMAPLGMPRDIPLVPVVYDLVSILYPETMREASRYIFGVTFERVIKEAELIISDSQTTANDLARLRGIEPDRIQVIHAAAGPHFTVRDRAAAAALMARKYGVQGDYVLCVATLEPRKNLPRAIKAFARVCQERQTSLQLVVAGARGWKTSAIYRTIQSLGMGDKVISLGYVDERDMPDAYNAAIALLFPSVYEGFGIPIVEAMACGIPVITSNVSSMPEVAGDAAILVDPLDVKSIAVGLKRLVDDRNLWQQMRERGLQRAKMFSWEGAARQTMEVLKSVAVRRRKRSRVHRRRTTVEVGE